MSSAVSVLYNREFRRHRYIEGTGWVLSSDTFFGRVQPKFNDSIQRTRPPDGMDIFLNVSLFRDAEGLISGFEQSTFTFPTSGQALTAAQTGIELAVGDRLYEEGSNYALMVRGNAQYRDGFLQHDEVICCEASQFDQRWIEYIEIGGLNSAPTGDLYDPIRRQFVKIEKNNLDRVNAFGIIESFNNLSFNSDDKVIMRGDEGKEITPKFIVNMDGDFNVTENNTLHFRGKDFKIMFIRETITRVQIIGVQVWKQQGMSYDTPNTQPSRNINLN